MARMLPGVWAVAAQLSGATEEFEIGTGSAEGAPERRVFRLDGEKPRAQSEIAQKLAAVWLTPQMDRLFTDTASGRRKFLDRLVIALEPSPRARHGRLRSARAQRNRLLAENPTRSGSTDWRNSCARHAVATTATRAALIAQLNSTLRAGVADPFPLVSLALDCPIAAKLLHIPALEVEDSLRAAYRAARGQDAGQRGASVFGPQKADLLITDAATSRPAALSSTGQQKAMLIGIVLGHADQTAAARGTAAFCCWTNRLCIWMPPTARRCSLRCKISISRPGSPAPMPSLSPDWMPPVTQSGTAL